MYNNQMLYIKILLILIFTTNLLYSKEKVTLQLDWLHQFQFAGYYIAKEKGYYEENNIDVTIKEFDYKTDLIKNVLEKEGNYSVGKSSLIIDKMQGKDIVLISAIYQSSPMVLISLKNNNIETIQDLKNKKVMLTPDARSAASINAMIKSQGVNLDFINFIPHSFKLNDLIEGKTDAMGSYLSNEPYILNQKGIDFNVLNPADYGFDFYGGLLFTSNKELLNNPSRVKNFHDATIKGWKFAFDNIEETAQLIYKKYNSQNKTLDALIYEGIVLKKLAMHDKGLLGDINKNKIDELKRLFLILGFNKNNDFNIDDLIFNKDRILFNNSEKNYMKNNSISLSLDFNTKPFSYKHKGSTLGLESDFWSLIQNKLTNDFNISKENHITKNNTNIINIEFNYNLKEKKPTQILSNTIANIPLAIATKNDKNIILNLSLLKNKRISILSSNDKIEILEKNYPLIKFIKVKSIDDGFNLLKKNEVFGFIDNILTLSHYISNENLRNIKVAGTLPYNLEIKLAIEKENSILVDILNKTIAQLSIEEKNSIINKYQLILYQEVKNYSWIYKFVLPLILFIIFILFINHKMRKEIKKRKRAEDALVDYANKDSLTKIYNRRKLEKLMSLQISQSKKENTTFSIIFFDIDNFKKINDEFGHNIGDKILISLSKIVSQNIRKSDIIGRWGGEEFIIILPYTDVNGALKTTEHLKELINNYNFGIGRAVTSSFGITQYKNKDTKKELVERADEAMYFVKNNGRNGIKIN